MPYQKKNNSNTCEECGGKCCKLILLETNKTDKYKIEFWEARGNERLKETNTTVIYAQKSPCQHISEEGRYGQYNNRPQLCKDFPLPTLPRVWRAVCPLFHERESMRSSIYKVFKE